MNSESNSSSTSLQDSNEKVLLKDETAKQLKKGYDLLQAIKCSGDSEQEKLTIAIEEPLFGYLTPIATHPDKISEEDIKYLTEWRNRYVHSFLTEFHATEKQTKNWLIDIVGKDPSKILFMVKNSQGESIGYMGIGFIDWQSGYGEADCIVRGKEAPKGSMSKALKELIQWAQDKLGLTKIGVRVRSDNPAVAFYEKLGFSKIKAIPLKKTQQKDKIIYIEDTLKIAREPSIVYMIYKDSTANTTS